MEHLWLWLAVIAERLLAIGVSMHILLHKRDVRAAIGWMGLVWLTPAVGSALYGLLGVNRIARRAERLREDADLPPDRDTDIEIARNLAGRYPNLVPIARLVDEVTRLPLTAGNRIEPLLNGDEAYPAMLRAIGAAEHSVGLATYIFDSDRAGALFLDALVAARQRGIAIRVLVDGVGKRYSKPPITKLLAARDIPHAVFLQPSLPWHHPYANLRNHRKILVVDGQIGFTGGLNIREGCLLELDTDHPVHDLHFRLLGPVVRHLSRSFALDWGFTTGEELEGDTWLPSLIHAGQSLARGVPDGPDEDFEAIYQVLLGALAEARERIRICTPYFLPDATLISALSTAALRGIEVEILVPAESNLKFVNWAAAAQSDQLLEAGCRILLTEPPFDHTKLLLVDHAWAFFGSANWDARSLQLNFEFNIECYDPELVEKLYAITENKRRTAQRATLEMAHGRPLWMKLRDGAVRLFSPYL
ncbi:MAG: phospholipase D-like domain-containing protein [Pseudomonadota bacterium]|nr:phospholipase D-like domain-containing protein [Pseudomonadota bacterium]